MADSKTTLSDEVPDTELTPVVAVLKNMGVKGVVIQFEGVLLPLQHPEERWLLPRYTKEYKNGAARKAVATIPDIFRTFIVTLLSHGLRVYVVTSRSSAENGNPHEVHDTPGFLYEGPQWVRHVLSYWLHPQVGEHLVVKESRQIPDYLKSLTTAHHWKRYQVLLCSADPQAIRQVRQNHFQGLFVEPQNPGQTFLF